MLHRDTPPLRKSCSSTVKEVEITPNDPCGTATSMNVPLSRNSFEWGTFGSSAARIVEGAGHHASVCWGTRGPIGRRMQNGPSSPDTTDHHKYFNTLKWELACTIWYILANSSHKKLLTSCAALSISSLAVSCYKKFNIFYKMKIVNHFALKPAS